MTVNYELTHLVQDDYYPCRATPEAKNKFIKAVFGSVLNVVVAPYMLTLPPSSRAMKRIREAAQQFTLVARGLEGSTFGYATVSM